MRLAMRQAKRIRQLVRIVERQSGRIMVLERRLRESEAREGRCDEQLLAENTALRARVAVLADLADPDARRLAAAVLKTIERL